MLHEIIVTNDCDIYIYIDGLMLVCSNSIAFNKMELTAVLYWAIDIW